MFPPDKLRANKLVVSEALRYIHRVRTVCMHARTHARTVPRYVLLTYTQSGASVVVSSRPFDSGFHCFTSSEHHSITASQHQRQGHSVKMRTGLQVDIKQVSIHRIPSSPPGVSH